MKPHLLLSIVVLVIATQLSSSDAMGKISMPKISTGTGNWSSPSLWNPSGVPGSGDDVVIDNGHTVTVDIDAWCYNVTINNGGILSMGVEVSLYIGKNMQNDGTFNHNGGAVQFSGTSLQTIAGTVDGGGYVARFGGVAINNSAGVRLLGNILIENNLDLDNGQFDLNGMGIRFNAAAIWRSQGTLIMNGGYFDLQGTIDLTYTVECTTGDELIPSNIGSLMINVGPGNSVTMATSTNSRSLVLNAGNLVTGANTLTVGYSGNIGTVTRTSGAVVGNFKRWITATTVSNLLLPVGTPSKYRPAVLSFTTAPTTEGTITASYVESDPGTNGVDLATNPIDDGGYSITKIATEGYWILTPGHDLNGGTYSIDLTGDGCVGVSDCTKLHILKRPSPITNWTVDGSHAPGTGSNAVPIAHRTGLTNFSEFGIGGNSLDNPLPVTTSNFSAMKMGGSVELYWSTVTELNNYGFAIQRADVIGQSSVNRQWKSIGFVEGAGTSNVVRNYSYRDNGMTSGIVAYRLKQIDRDGGVEYSREVTVNVLPERFELSQNYPNPFNPMTNIEWRMPNASHVKLSVLDLLGREVAALVNERKDAGWYSVQWDAAAMPSGVYFYTLTAGNIIQTRRMLLLK